MFNLKERSLPSCEKASHRNDTGYSYFSVRRIILLQLVVLLFGVILFSILLLQYFKEEMDCGAGCEVKPIPNQFRYTIVTAASSNHFCSLLGFLYSLQDTKLFLDKSEMPRVITYDMNLSDEEQSKLHSLKDQGYLHHIKRFNFPKYPKFWDVNKSRGEYGWKAGMINEVAEEFPGTILWMDSGNRVFPHFLRKAVGFVEENGFWSPSSSGTVKDYTHPGVFDYFNDAMDKYSTLRNCNGAMIGLNTRNYTVMNKIIKPFRECALVQDCIAPKGSSRANHRQDQSILTYLVHANGWKCSSEGWTGYLIHQDGDCEERIRQHSNRLFSKKMLTNY